MFLCSGKECQVHSRLAVEKLTNKKRAYTPAQSQAVVSEEQHTVVPVGKLPWSEGLDAALTQNVFLVSDHECSISKKSTFPLLIPTSALIRSVCSTVIYIPAGSIQAFRMWEA